MDDQYTQKYLKYKRKYLALEREMQLVGGTGFLSKIASNTSKQMAATGANFAKSQAAQLGNELLNKTAAIAAETGANFANSQAGILANQAKTTLNQAATQVVQSVQAGVKAGINTTILTIISNNDPSLVGPLTMLLSSINANLTSGQTADVVFNNLTTEQKQLLARFIALLK